MEFVLANNLSQHSYVLSGKRAFFYRFCDTGFKRKWTGLWLDSKKFIEYFAFKINDIWLSNSNCSTFVNGKNYATHNFLLEGMKVKEFSFIPEDIGSLVCLLTIENESPEKKKITIEMEIAANIREREENWHSRTYEAKPHEDRVTINSTKGCLTFGSSPSGFFKLNPEYRDHYPGELQRCFIPGNYKVSLELGPSSKKDVFFIFSCGNTMNESMADYDITRSSLFSLFLEKEKIYKELLSNSKFVTNITELEDLFDWSVLSLEKLAFKSKFGYGYFAGYPWFTQFWGRDSCWMIPAIIDYGNFEAAKISLETLAKFQKYGAIPNIIYPNGTTDYNSIDSTPLWIIALFHYVNNSGDLPFLFRMEEKLDDSIGWCKERDVDGDYFLEHEPKATWMDTLERKKGVEVQAFWIEALKSAASMFKLLGRNNENKRMGEMARKIEQKFENEFWNEKEDLYFDSIGSRKNGIKTINSIFPLIFDLPRNKKKILEMLESDKFSSKYGIRTLANDEENYNPAGYHTGSTWGWLTAMMSGAEFKNNRPEKGMEYLEILLKYMNSNCLGAIEEAWNSDDGNSTLFKDNIFEEGCFLQGWNSALVVRCIDEWILGININAMKKTITISPSLVNGMKAVRRKRIGNDFVDIQFKRIGNRLKVDYSSKNKEKYNMTVLPRL